MNEEQPEISKLEDPLKEIPKKLTLAEKKELKKQLARQEKLEKKLQEAEDERQITRDYLSREQKYGDINRKNLEKEWRRMLIHIKLPIIRKEFQSIMNTVERLFEAKDLKISLMMDELDDAGFQTQLVNQSHLETIQKYIETFRNQLDHIKNKYDEDLNKVENDRKGSLLTLSNRNEYNDDFLKMMIYALDRENKQTIKVDRSEYMSKINMKTIWYDSKVRIMKNDNEKIFKELYNGYSQVFKEFLDYTTNKKEEYESLKRDDASRQKNMLENMSQIINCYDRLKKYNDTRKLIKKDLHTQYKHLDRQRKFFKESFRVLRKKLIINTKNDEKQLIELTNKSNDTISYLTSIKRKGEKILKHMSMCEKYETQKEKILPFPRVNMILRRDQSTIFPPNINISEEFTPFWQKVAQADTTRQLLHAEEIFLKKENEELKTMLRKYCGESVCRCVLPTIPKRSKTNQNSMKINEKNTDMEEEMFIIQSIQQAKQPETMSLLSTEKDVISERSIPKKKTKKVKINLS